MKRVLQKGEDNDCKIDILSTGWSAIVNQLFDFFREKFMGKKIIQIAARIFQLNASDKYTNLK